MLEPGIPLPRHPKQYRYLVTIEKQMRQVALIISYLDSLGIGVLADELTLAVSALLGKPVLELFSLGHLV